MLKTAEPKKGGVGIGGDSRAGCSQSKGNRSGMDDIEVEFEVDEIRKKVRNSSKSKNLSKSKNTVRCSDFLIPGAKLAFIKLRQAFLKAPILHHFNPKRHIWIETDAPDYAIGGVLSQLTSDDLTQWHLVVFLSRKMIQAETRYETHNGEL